MVIRVSSIVVYIKVLKRKQKCDFYLRQRMNSKYTVEVRDILYLTVFTHPLPKRGCVSNIEVLHIWLGYSLLLFAKDRVERNKSLWNKSLSLTHFNLIILAMLQIYQLDLTIIRLSVSVLEFCLILQNKILQNYIWSRFAW